MLWWNFAVVILFCVVNSNAFMQGFLGIRKTANTGRVFVSMRKQDFPILDKMVNSNAKLVYLDSAATSQVPKCVQDAMNSYFDNNHANVHRGMHALARSATTLYENARGEVQSFIGAAQREEVVFTRGATESINIVAHSLAKSLKPGDEILLSVMEHHSNIVPWQMAAAASGAVIKYIDVDSESRLDLKSFEDQLSPKTKIVAISHVSNVLGLENPIKHIVSKSHEVGSLVLIDACQSLPHMRVNVQELGADFVVASAHKMCGPTGIGLLYGRKDVLETLYPVYGGGEMIDTVTLHGSTFTALPLRLESGTPPIAQAIGFAQACRYLTHDIGIENIETHGIKLSTYLGNKVKETFGNDFGFIGPQPNDSENKRFGLVSLVHKSLHCSDLAMFLDIYGIAVRSGNHCAQPFYHRLGIPGSLRVSHYFYNDESDVDMFIEALVKSVNAMKR